MELGVLYSEEALAEEQDPPLALLEHESSYTPHVSSVARPISICWSIS